MKYRTISLLSTLILTAVNQTPTITNLNAVYGTWLGLCRNTQAAGCTALLISSGLSERERATSPAPVFAQTIFW